MYTQNVSTLIDEAKIIFKDDHELIELIKNLDVGPDTMRRIFDHIKWPSALVGGPPDEVLETAIQNTFIYAFLREWEAYAVVKPYLRGETHRDLGNRER